MSRVSQAKIDEMKKKCHDYYIQGKTIIYTSIETGYDKKTVAKYFDEFSQLQLESRTEQFINTQKRVKEQTLYSMDKIIDKSSKQLEELEQKVDVELGEDLDITESIRVQQLMNKIHNDMFQWINSKAELESTPTLDIKISELVDEKLTENDQ